MTKAEAKVLHKYYDDLITTLTKAKIALVEGGAQSYTIGDRSLTRFDLSKISSEITDAIRRRDECAAIMQGKATRKMVAAIPSDM